MAHYPHPCGIMKRRMSQQAVDFIAAEDPYDEADTKTLDSVDEIHGIESKS